MGETNRMWWTHPGLTARDGRLLIAGRDAAALARRHGTPLYVYDLTRIGEQIEALQTALDRAKLASRVRVALKAQHEPEVLAYIHRRFPPGAGRGVGLDVLLRHAVHVNLDGMRQLRRGGRPTHHRQEVEQALVRFEFAIDCKCQAGRDERPVPRVECVRRMNTQTLSTPLRSTH